jgi:uncharacterized lipoprotein
MVLHKGLKNVLPLSACVGAVLAVSGCSALRDRGSDYRVVENLPPLVLPAGQENRPIQPLYPIPPGPDAKFDLSQKFKVPAPKPLVLSAAPVDASAKKTTDIAALPQKPVLTQDGNGYAVLSITGDFNPIWDRLDIALRSAGVKVDDRDQRVGLYYLNLADDSGKKTVYQLRMTRGQSAYTLALQKDNDTLASQAMTKMLFESIVSKWPTDSGEDVNGKARPSIYR